MDRSEKVADLTVKEFKELSLGLKRDILDGWFSDITEKVSNDISAKLESKIDMRIDSKLMSVGINAKEPKKEQCRQAFLDNLITDTKTMRHGFISQIGSGIAGGAIVGFVTWINSFLKG